jgi:hypothetical protein
VIAAPSADSYPRLAWLPELAVFNAMIEATLHVKEKIE